MTFGISKCADVVYEKGKMSKGEELIIDNSKAECLNLEGYDYY